MIEVGDLVQIVGSVTLTGQRHIGHVGKVLNESYHPNHWIVEGATTGHPAGGIGVWHTDNLRKINPPNWEKLTQVHEHRGMEVE